MFWLWFSLSLVNAQEVLLMEPQSSVSEYRAFLQAHPDLISPTETYERQRPARALRENLLEIFAEAQALFLSHDKGAAKTKFQGLLKLRTFEDWKAQDHEIFALSYLRLAQLSESQEERVDWLKSAATFHDVEIDPSLIPPPLLEEWRQIVRNTPLAAVRFTGLGGEWSRVIVDGRSCDKNPCQIKGAEAKPIRATWISDRWQPFSVTVSLSRLSQIIPTRRAWVEGRCDSPILAKETGRFETKRAFFTLQCEEARSDALPLAQLKPQAPSTSANIFTPEPERREFYKSPWLWLGVGSVVAVIVANSQKEKAKDPTTTYGY